MHTHGEMGDTSIRCFCHVSLRQEAEGEKEKGWFSQSVKVQAKVLAYPLSLIPMDGGCDLGR